MKTINYLKIGILILIILILQSQSKATAEDPYTKLLLHMDGTDASTTFTDKAGKTVKAINNAQIDATQSKFGGASGVFNNNTIDYLNLSHSEDWDFGTGDFTIDGWMYLTSPPTASSWSIIQHGRIQGGTDGWGMILDINTLYFQNWANGAATLDIRVNSHPWTTNTWYHLAVTRSGNNLTIFVNGTALNSIANTADISQGNHSLTLGATDLGDIGFPGYLDEFRISKGIARWTTNFDPFSSDNEYTVDSYTKLLLHMNGVNGSANFTDEAGKNVFTGGNAQIDTAQKKFGTASALFYNNTYDFINLSDSDDWNFGTEDFTIDFWIRWNTLPTGGLNYHTLFEQIQGGNDQNLVYAFDWDGLGTSGIGFQWQVLSGGATLLNHYDRAERPSTNTWYHLAFVRNGTVFSTYFNGTLNSDQTADITMPDLADTFTIGAREWNGVAYPFDGWIDEFRISKGIARWTGNFDPFSFLDQYGCLCPSYYASTSNWEIDLADSCTVKSTCDLTGENITFRGTGSITLNTTITANSISQLPANQTGYLGSNAVIKVG